MANSITTTPNIPHHQTIVKDGVSYVVLCEENQVYKYSDDKFVLHDNKLYRVVEESSPEGAYLSAKKLVGDFTYYNESLGGLYGYEVRLHEKFGLVMYSPGNAYNKSYYKFCKAKFVKNLMKK